MALTTLSKGLHGRTTKILPFLKAKSAEFLNMAFKEFSAKELTKSKKTPIKEKLRNLAEQVKLKNKERSRKRKRDFNMKFNKQKVIKGLLFLMFGYFVNKLSQTYQVATGANIGDKIMSTVNGIGGMFKNPLPSFNPIDLLVGAAVGALVMLVIYVNGRTQRNTEKVASAALPVGVLSRTSSHIRLISSRITYSDENRTAHNGEQTEIGGAKFARNKNILVIGGSGSGKTRFLKPNLLQMQSSYIVTDPKGTVLLEVGNALNEGGCNIKVVNTINFAKSMHYNPFENIRSEKDILKFVNALIAIANDKGSRGGEESLVKVERLHYSELIGYIW